MPYHKLLDQEGEAKLGKLQIGTTRRGIGPCYADKAARLGIRMQDLLDENILRKKIYAAMEPKRLMLRPYAKLPELDLHTMTEEYRTHGHRLEQFIADTPPIAWRTLDEGGLVVFEGAQGALLDIDHGTYPFVTSSNTVAAAAGPGAGVGPGALDEVWGIAKAYTTRVGAGPVPHRARRRARRSDPRGGRRVRHHHRAARGAPAGSTWSRSSTPRAINGLTGLVVTKLDVLTGIDPLHIGVRYLGPEGATFDEFPYHQSIVHRVHGDYVEMPGWHEDIRGCRSIDELPANAQAYLDFISESLGVPIVMVGVGPGREQMIWTGAAERAPPRRRLSALGLHDVRRHDHVVERAVLVVPERPAEVQQPGDERHDRRGDPDEEALDHDLAQRAKPKLIGSPVSRITRMPSGLLAPASGRCARPRAPSGAARTGARRPGRRGSPAGP